MLGHENSEKDPSLENRSKIPGFCTGEGTRRYKERAVEKLGIPEANFKKPYDLPLRKG